MEGERKGEWERIEGAGERKRGQRKAGGCEAGIGRTTKRTEGRKSEGKRRVT